MLPGGSARLCCAGADCVAGMIVVSKSNAKTFFMRIALNNSEIERIFEMTLVDAKLTPPGLCYGRKDER